MGVLGLEVFGIAVCLGLTSVRLPSKGRTKETVAAPVVSCSCCVVGLAPARTAAVWLSVWTAGITGKPFTLAQAAVCSPSPSELIHSEISALSFLFLLFASSAYPHSPYARLLSATFHPLYAPVCLSVFLSPLHPSSFYFFLSPTISFCLLTHTNTNINSISR